MRAVDLRHPVAKRQFPGNPVLRCADGQFHDDRIAVSSLARQEARQHSLIEKRERIGDAGSAPQALHAREDHQPVERTSVASVDRPIIGFWRCARWRCCRWSDDRVCAEASIDERRQSVGHSACSKRQRVGAIQKIDHRNACRLLEGHRLEAEWNKRLSEANGVGERQCVSGEGFFFGRCQFDRGVIYTNDVVTSVRRQPGDAGIRVGSLSIDDLLAVRQAVRGWKDDLAVAHRNAGGFEGRLSREIECVARDLQRAERRAHRQHGIVITGRQVDDHVLRVVDAGMFQDRRAIDTGRAVDERDRMCGSTYRLLDVDRVAVGVLAGDGSADAATGQEEEEVVLLRGSREILDVTERDLRGRLCADGALIGASNLPIIIKRRADERVGARSCIDRDRDCPVSRQL